MVISHSYVKEPRGSAWKSTFCMFGSVPTQWIESRQILDHEDIHLRHLIGDLDHITLKKIYDFLVPGDYIIYILDAQTCV